MDNYMKLEIAAKGENASFARSAVAAFALSLNPTVSEISDIKTAVSEAVTNAIVHGYSHKNGEIEMRLFSEKNLVHIEIMDDGCGISDIEKARQPFYTTCTDGTRSGMGFTVMESFMDEIKIASAPEEGTRVVMKKLIGGKK